MRAAVPWAILLALPAGALPAEALVTLTMTERAGVERKGEVVTFGLPLPKGKVKSAGRLSLTSAGRAIPAEIIPVTRWCDDGSLRWVHLIFPADCPAKAARKLTLALGDAPPPPARTLRATEQADRIVIDTGAVRLAVRKSSFNLIDSASAGGAETIRPHRRGLGVKVGGVEYLAGLDAGAKVRLEEASGFRAVVRASGAFRNAAGERKFDFDCRLYAYAGSGNVRVVVTVLNRQGKLAQPMPLEACFIDLPTTVRAGSCLFGSEDGIKSARLAGDGEAFLYQPAADRHVFGGAVEGAGKGKSTKTCATGWGGLTDGEAGLAAGVKWFWQLFPKSVEVNADGLLRVGLYPARHGRAIDIYPGVARTHEVTLAFGPGEAKTLRGVFAALQRPLRPFAPPKWYCRDTRCFGELCEAGGKELYGEFAPAVKRFDEAFEQANRRCQAFRDLRVKKGVRTESYGFLGYGDGVHWVWTPNVDVPENICWDGNYYGYPHMMCTQFLRTGKLEYFDNFEAHALHVADVHTVHYAAERKHLLGACRYCPPTDHVRIDPANGKDYKTARVYVSNTFNHHKVAGVIDRWYFLRDHRCRDVADMVLGYVHRYRAADNDYGQPRGPGTVMSFCADACALYGRKDKWVKRAANVLRLHKGRKLKLSFQAGIFLAGLRRYHEISGDPEALAYIKDSCDRILAAKRGGGNPCAAMTFLYRKTGQRKYLDAALKALPTSSRFSNPWKDFALSMHNAHLAIGDLHHIARRQGQPAQ